MSKLGLSNRILFQWFGFRLARRFHHSSGKMSWHILRWVWPMTGWESEYRWIKRVWPPVNP